MDRLLTVTGAADRLGTSVRFVRPLIADRRIPYVKVGRHVRRNSPASHAAGEMLAGTSTTKALRWTTST
jgi:excisionase family DNA binding protein